MAEQLTIDPRGKWRFYWGAMPLPDNSEAVGTVRRDIGDTGALIYMKATGVYVQGNAGSIRSLPPLRIVRIEGLDFYSKPASVVCMESEADEILAQWRIRERSRTRADGEAVTHWINQTGDARREGDGIGD